MQNQDLDSATDYGDFASVDCLDSPESSWNNYKGSGNF